MNATNGKDRFHHPKHRDDSNAAWTHCVLRDVHRHDDVYQPRHAKPIPMGGAA